MIGTFVQTNGNSRYARSRPLGYVIQKDGCWEWTGHRDYQGYGRQKVDGRVTLAHRAVYEEQIGEIPAGKQCHHICANPSCVNPSHIDIVTPTEHVARDAAKQAWYAKNGARMRAKTHCPRGHPYTGENLYVNPTNKTRHCRACLRRQALRYYYENKARGLEATEIEETEEGDDL